MSLDLKKKKCMVLFLLVSEPLGLMYSSVYLQLGWLEIYIFKAKILTYHMPPRSYDKNNELATLDLVTIWGKTILTLS